MADVPGFIGNSSIWSLVPDSCTSRVDPSRATEEGADKFFRRWSNCVQVRRWGWGGVRLRAASQTGHTVGTHRAAARPLRPAGVLLMLPRPPAAHAHAQLEAAANELEKSVAHTESAKE